MMAATAVLGILRRQLLVVTAFATGVLLLCDAWFDVMTAHGEDRAWSVATALVVELPLSAVLIAGSLQVLRLVAARLWAVEGGAHVWQVRIPLPARRTAPYDAGLLRLGVALDDDQRKPRRGVRRPCCRRCW